MLDLAQYEQTRVISVTKTGRVEDVWDVTLLDCAADDLPHSIITNGVLTHNSGNDASSHSLRFFQALVKQKHLRHVHIYADQPETVEIEDERVRFLPWPHTEAEEDCLHVLHVECRGAKYDSGRPIGEEAHDLSEMIGVAGHLYQAQRAGDIHFSGTMYQTNFGESLPKYFHDGTWRNGKLKVKKVETTPEIQLHNVIIATPEDFKTLPTHRNHLCKVFVKKEVVLRENAFDAYPNVVKINSYRTESELKTLMKNELRIENASFAFDEEEYLRSWLKTQDEDKVVRRRALELYKELRGDTAAT